MVELGIAFEHVGTGLLLQLMSMRLQPDVHHEMLRDQGLASPARAGPVKLKHLEVLSSKPQAGLTLGPRPALMPWAVLGLGSMGQS